MNVTLRYLGHSRLAELAGGRSLDFAPNLAREPVAFDGALRSPLRFREAISALHDVVISDLRFKPRDKSAYEAWKRQEQQRVAALRKQEYEQAKGEILARRGDVPPDLERHYNAALRRYWNARQQYSNYLVKHDMEMWRLLMPCDPVITVADDVLFFECFSADESSYGCLTVQRDEAFGPSPDWRYGTTNVDYSWPLYHSFQTLRSYRQTRFRVDPAGFEVATQGAAEYREEKIDLPPGWLRGFMQIQGAMGLPMRKVSLSREAVYSLLAWLKRHKARQSPRALRFELLAGRSPSLVLEPWEQRVTSHATRYEGPEGEPIRIWGRQRLLVLARVLPLVERFDVYLLGTGLPSFWVAQMGEMRLTVGLSGWTTNDWTRGSSLDLLAPPAAPGRDLVGRIAALVRQRKTVSLEEIRRNGLTDLSTAAAAMNQLAHTGQAIYDLAAGVYRWRQVMPQALGEAELGPENVEARESRALLRSGRMTINSRRDLDAGLTLYTGQSDGAPLELMLSADGVIKRGKCNCSHHFKAGLRRGPCRHLLALRALALQTAALIDATSQSWYDRLQKWAQN